MKTTTELAKELYSDIVVELTAFENSDSEVDETTPEDWNAVFYRLLVRAQKALDRGVWSAPAPDEDWFGEIERERRQRNEL